MSESIQDRIKVKTLTDVYLCLGQAFQEHTKFKNEETGLILYKTVVRGYAEDAIPLETVMLVLKQLSYDYSPAKQLWRALVKVIESERKDI